MTEGRSIEKRNYKYDVYKTRRGEVAQLAFQKLAKRLVRKKINPAIYLKVMGTYGKFESANFMPPPGWLSKWETIKIFTTWMHANRRNRYELKLDWKKAFATWSDQDIFKDLEDSRYMVQQVMDASNADFEETVYVLRAELGPWFMATFSFLSMDRDTKLCRRFLLKHPQVKKKALRIISKNN